MEQLLGRSRLVLRDRSEHSHGASEVHWGTWVTDNVER